MRGQKYNDLPWLTIRQTFNHCNDVQERVRGQEYDDLLDELIAALRERYGARVIIHWEDFNVRNSFRLLDKYVAQVQQDTHLGICCT